MVRSRCDSLRERQRHIEQRKQLDWDHAFRPVLYDWNLQVVFKVPRLEAHLEEGQPPTYTIVVPKYAAEEKRTQAAEERVDGDQSRMISRVEHMKLRYCVGL